MDFEPRPGFFGGSEPSASIIEKRPSIAHKLRRIEKQERFQRDHKIEFELLTKRELELIDLLVKGYNNPRIAEYLFISRHTVEQHRKNINKKLGIKSFSELFQYALAFDLV